METSYIDVSWPTSLLVMVSTHGITVKMLQNTVHRGLILWKVSINEEDDY